MLPNVVMSTINNLTVQQLRKAADLKERIDSLETQLSQLLGGAVAAAAPKRKMSASAKAKIGAAQRKRWAKVKGKSGAEKPAKQKRAGKMSAAGKAAVSARMKAYWAARKAAKK